MNSFEKLSPAEQKQIMAAVESLLVDNDKLPDQLTRLADLKTNKPLTWKMALNILNKG